MPTSSSGEWSQRGAAVGSPPGARAGGLVAGGSLGDLQQVTNQHWGGGPPPPEGVVAGGGGGGGVVHQSHGYNNIPGSPGIGGNININNQPQLRHSHSSGSVRSAGEVSWHSAARHRGASVGGGGASTIGSPGGRGTTGPAVVPPNVSPSTFSALNPSSSSSVVVGGVVPVIGGGQNHGVWGSPPSVSGAVQHHGYYQENINTMGAPGPGGPSTTRHGRSRASPQQQGPEYIICGAPGPGGGQHPPMGQHPHALPPPRLQPPPAGGPVSGSVGGAYGANVPRNYAGSGPSASLIYGASSHPHGMKLSSNILLLTELSVRISISPALLECSFHVSINIVALIRNISSAPPRV